MSNSSPPAPFQPRYNMRYVWGISLVAALGGLMFGYDWIVIGGTKPFYERFFIADHRLATGLGHGQRPGRLPDRGRPLRHV